MTATWLMGGMGDFKKDLLFADQDNLMNRKSLITANKLEFLTILFFDSELRISYINEKNMTMCFNQLLLQLNRYPIFLKTVETNNVQDMT